MFASIWTIETLTNVFLMQLHEKNFVLYKTIGYIVLCIYTNVM